MYGIQFSEDPETGQKVARIEIIPLIDVIFFLLATFVLFTLSLDRTGVIELDLPVAPPPPILDIVKVEPVMLQVSGNGEYFWDRELMSLTEVKAELTRYAEAPDAKVMLTTDDRANYGDTIRLLDSVRAAGIEQVSIETRYRARGM